MYKTQIYNPHYFIRPNLTLISNYYKIRITLDRIERK